MTVLGRALRIRAGTLFTQRPVPVLAASDWPTPVGAVFNPAATVHDGQTILLCRVEDRRGISQLAVARSFDGVTGWRMDERPLITADVNDPQTCFGVQDPRVTWVEELAAYVIAYVGHGRDGTGVSLAVTHDFRSVEHIGRVMSPEDGNACLLPRHIGGQFVLFHRPVSHRTHRADIWLSRSTDLRGWSDPELVLAARDGTWWDSARVGMGPPPIETPDGWLGIYHGVQRLEAGAVWRVGLVLLDLHEPARVLHRTDSWVLGPHAYHERCGDVPNRLIPSGLIHDPATDQLRLYYGAADTCVGMATAQLADVLDYVLSCPADGGFDPPERTHPRM